MRGATGQRSEVTDQRSENEEARMVRAGRALNEELLLLLVIDSEVRYASGLTPSQRGLRPGGESTTARRGESILWRISYLTLRVFSLSVIR